MVPNIHPPCPILHAPNSEILPKIVEFLDLPANLGEQVQRAQHPRHLSGQVGGPIDIS
jgi:hypothetical protein